MNNFNVTCLSCFGCCPILVLNSLREVSVANASTQSDSDPVATASLVFAENQVNRMQTVEGQVNQGLSASTQSDQVAVATNFFDQDGVGQGQVAGTVLSKFINPFPLALVTEDLIQEGSELQELENRGNTPPPPPPPPRNQNFENVTLVEEGLRADISQGDNIYQRIPEEERPDSPPPPPPPRQNSLSTTNQSLFYTFTTDTENKSGSVKATEVIFPESKQNNLINSNADRDRPFLTYRGYVEDKDIKECLTADVSVTFKSSGIINSAYISSSPGQDCSKFVAANIGADELTIVLSKNSPPKQFKHKVEENRDNSKKIKEMWV
jgi:hypothetical protein